MSKNRGQRLWPAGKAKSSNQKLHRFVSLEDLTPQSMEDIKRRERAFQLQFDLKDIRVVGKAYIHEAYYSQVIEEVEGEQKGWCTCEDFRYRRAEKGKPCKHLIGLKFALEKVNVDLIKGCKREIIITGSPMD